MKALAKHGSMKGVFGEKKGRRNSDIYWAQAMRSQHGECCASMISFSLHRSLWGRRSCYSYWTRWGLGRLPNLSWSWNLRRRLPNHPRLGEGLGLWPGWRRGTLCEVGRQLPSVSMKAEGKVVAGGSGTGRRESLDGGLCTWGRAFRTSETHRFGRSRGGGTPPSRKGDSGARWLSWLFPRGVLWSCMTGWTCSPCV